MHAMMPSCWSHKQLVQRKAAQLPRSSCAHVVAVCLGATRQGRHLRTLAPACLCLLPDLSRTACQGLCALPSPQILEYNLRTQRQNNAPPDFPAFVREGYDMTSEPGLLLSFLPLAPPPALLVCRHLLCVHAVPLRGSPVESFVCNGKRVTFKQARRITALPFPWASRAATLRAYATVGP